MMPRNAIGSWARPWRIQRKWLCSVIAASNPELARAGVRIDQVDLDDQRVSNQRNVIEPQPLELARAPIKISAEEPLRNEGRLITHDEEARPGELVRERLARHDRVLLARLTLIEAPRRLVIADSEVGCLHECPAQVLVAVFHVALAFLLAVACPLGSDATTVRNVIADVCETRELTGLEPDRHRQNRTDAPDRLEQLPRPIRSNLPEHGRFDLTNLLVECQDDGLGSAQGHRPVRVRNRAGDRIDRLSLDL